MARLAEHSVRSLRKWPLEIRDLFSRLRLLLRGSCGAARLGRSPLGGLGLVGLLLYVLFLLLLLAVTVRGPLLVSLLPGLEARSDKKSV